MKENQNILLSRTDAIGDVVLSLPIAGILKNLYPQSTIYFLGQTYTKDIIESSVHIDKFLDWTEIKKLSTSSQIEYFKSLNISFALHIFPNIQISWLFKKAGIPIRIGTSRRWYHHLFCNKLISFSRRRSNMHEAQLNLNLLAPLGYKEMLPVKKLASFYGIQPPHINESFIRLLDKERFNLILHPKSRGNGKEWGLDNFSKLIQLLDSKRFKIFITGTENEYQIIEQEILKRHPEVVSLVGKMTLQELLGFIAKADGLVASGTGPIHLAAATGINAIGLYPPVRPVFSRRWAPIGVNAKSFEAKKICVKCNKSSKCDCLSLLSPNIIATYLKQQKKVNIQSYSQEENINNSLLKAVAITSESYLQERALVFSSIKKSTKRQTYYSIDSPYDKTHVLVALDKINQPNCGLGRVALDFSKALVNKTDENIDLTYVLNGINFPDYFQKQKTEKLNFTHRVYPAYYGHFDVLHYLHQSPSHKINGAKKTVITIHDLNFLFTKSKSKAKRYLSNVQTNVNNANAIVFISNFTRDICMKHLTIEPDKIVRVIYNGVELSTTKPEKPAFLPKGDYLFSIGQFLAKKNFHVLIPFLKKLPKTYLIIAGEKDTAYGNFVRKTAIEHGVQDRVILPGPVTEAEKLYLYDHCKAFVFPSLAEGFGLPIIEAMRMGKPVFCSDKTSLKEIGANHAYFWESFDPDNMVAVFTNGMNDFSEVKKELAYKYSMQFSWKKNAEEYIELYKQLSLRN